MLGMLCSPVLAQLSVNTISTTYTIDFDGTLAGVNNGQFASSGLQPIPAAGQLDSDAWSVEGCSDGDVLFGATGVGNDHTRGVHTGTGVIAGGIYAFGGGSIAGRALGVQPSANDLTRGDIYLRLLNNTGAVIDQLDISYELHVRNDEDRSNYFNFEHSPDHVSYWAEPSLDYTSPAAQFGNTFASAGTMTISLGCLNLLPGDFYYLHWETNDVGGSGARDEFAIDDLQISAEPFTQITYYSRNSGNQTTNVGTSTQLWAQTPGGVGVVQFPMDRCADYVVQTGDVVTLTGSGNAGLTINDLTVEPGGQLFANTNTSNPRYFNLRGDLTCNGTIGNGNGNVVGNGIAFNIEDGMHTISGSGVFDCARIRKSDVNGQNGDTDLIIDMDLDCHIGGSGLYNNRLANSLMNTTINAGATVNMSRIAIDGTNGNGIAEAGGSTTVNGTLNLSIYLYPYSNNTTNPCSMTIGPTGRVNTAAVWMNASGGAGSSITILPGGHLDLTGNNAWLLFNLTNNTLDFQPGSTVEYSSTSGQTVRALPTYGNIVFSGGGNKTLNGADLNVVNDLTIVNSATLVPGAFDIFLQGDWINYSALGFTEGGSTVTFNGSVDQFLTCGGAENLNNLVVDKPLGGNLILNDGLNIVNNLGLIQGFLIITGYKLVIDTPLPSGISRTAGHIVTEDPTLFGNVIWEVGGNTQLHEVPFGRLDGTYLPMSFQIISGSTPEVRVGTYPTPPDNLPWPPAPVNVTNLNSWIGLAPDNRDATVDRFWFVGQFDPALQLDISLSYAADELPIPPYNVWPQIEAQRYNRTTNEWEPSLPGQIQTDLGGVYDVFVPNYNSYGIEAWAFAPTFAPLPIELLDFQAAARDNTVELEWSTASETNNEYFTIERSADAVEFHEIGFVDGALNSHTQIDYDYIDGSPFGGISYYRLKQTDTDGTYSYSDVRAVNMATHANIAQVWSNGDQILVKPNGEAPVDMVIRDVVGRELMNQLLDENSNVQVIQVPAHISHPSVLLISLTQNRRTQSQKLLY